MMAAIVFALVALGAISSANAGEIVMHTGSRHWPDRGSDGVRLNNHNPGFGYIFDNGLMVGAYTNSYRRASAYAGYLYERRIAGPLGAGFSVAAATGYGGRRIAPIAGAVVSWEVASNARVRLMLAPRLSSRGQSVAHVSVGVSP